MKGVQADFDSQASKAGLEGDYDHSTLAIQNKMLSLELILIMLKKKEAFRSGEKFVEAIRKYLCMSLLGNCTSQVTAVIGLSLQIFVSLMDGFKEHLKTEFEVFSLLCLSRSWRATTARMTRSSEYLKCFIVFAKTARIFWSFL